MNKINKFLYEPHGGQFQEFIGINCFFEPDDSALYRKLIPTFWDVPQQPVVFAYAANFIRLAPWWFRPYQEWSVFLKCLWDGVSGWHCVTMPVTTWLANVGGRNLGFPKYIASSISLNRHENDWIAQSKHQGKVQFVMQFSPGLERPLVPWEQLVIDNRSFFIDGDAYLLVPPGKGPKKQRVRFVNVTPPNWSPVLGMVNLTVAPEEPWSGLVPSGQPMVGTFNHFKGGFNLVAVD